jgi:hypothetical protein
MKINYLKRYLIGIAMIAFLAILAGNAFAVDALGDNASRDFLPLTAGKEAKSNYANNYMVMAPYWQAASGNSYTFVAVSHSSLSGMASQIGVVIHAITSDKTAYDTAQSFTVSAGETKRVFIISTNHGTINRTSIPDAVFLAGTTNFAYGHVRINPQTTHPMLRVNESVIRAVHHGDGFRDSTMLSYWGSVIVEANATGFAMEFIGDMNDSQTLAVDHLTGLATSQRNDHHMASGVNLQ